MAISARRLGEGEYVVAFTRRHRKALVLPVLALLGMCALTGFLLAWACSGRRHEALTCRGLAISSCSVLWLPFRPFMR